jgi:hypothetical protein
VEIQSDPRYFPSQLFGKSPISHGAFTLPKYLMIHFNYMQIKKHHLRIGRLWFVTAIISAMTMYFALSLTTFASLDLFFVAIVIISGAVYLRLNDILDNLPISLFLSLSLPVLTFLFIATITFCDYTIEKNQMCNVVNFFDYNALVYGYLSILSVTLLYLSIKAGRSQ